MKRKFLYRYVLTGSEKRKKKYWVVTADGLKAAPVFPDRTNMWQDRGCFGDLAQKLLGPFQALKRARGWFKPELCVDHGALVGIDVPLRIRERCRWSALTNPH